MANNTNSEQANQAPNTNKQAQQGQQMIDAGSLKAGQKLAADEAGFKRVPINVNDPKNQQKLIDLQWYLGIANPVYQTAKIKVNRLTSDGKKVEDTIEKSVFDHFDYPNVAGDNFDQWLTKTFGENVKVDPFTKEVYTLVSDQNTPTPEPQPQNPSQETQTQPTENPNPNDPDNN